MPGFPWFTVWILNTSITILLYCKLSFVIIVLELQCDITGTVSQTTRILQNVGFKCNLLCVCRISTGFLQASKYYGGKTRFQSQTHFLLYDFRRVEASASHLFLHKTEKMIVRGRHVSRTSHPIFPISFLVRWAEWGCALSCWRMIFPGRLSRKARRRSWSVWTKRRAFMLSPASRNSRCCMPKDDV